MKNLPSDVRLKIVIPRTIEYWVGALHSWIFYYLVGSGVFALLNVINPGILGILGIALVASLICITVWNCGKKVDLFMFITESQKLLNKK